MSSKASRRLLAIALACWPAGVVRAQAVTRTPPSALERSVDASVRPGDDFFTYANGGWLKATTIPAGKDRWGIREELSQVTRQRVEALLAGGISAAPGTAARKAADFLAAYLNESAIEARGLAPLQAQLDSVDRMPDKTALTQFLGRWMLADVDPLNWGVYRSAHLLGLSVEPSIHGEKSYVAFLLQGGLGLPDRETYLSSEPRMLALRATYQAYIGRMLSLAGFDRATQRAAAVMALETAIARSQATPEASAVDHNADSIWTRADFARQAPGMDWSEFFAAAGLTAQETFVPWQPGAVRGVAALVASQSLQAWQDYLRFHAVHDHADLLPRAFAAQAVAMHDAANAQPLPASRAQRALDATQLAMSEEIGKLYADAYFPAAQKVRVQRIVANVAAAFVRRVEVATWMSPDTKARALAKLKTLYIGIGYPDRWQDDADLVVDPRDAMGNARRVADHSYHRALALLGRAVDMTDWWIAPQTVGAVLVFQQNAYDFSAALLQAPKFDPAGSDAANYGAIGAIIGHDVSHFVDVLGAEYDVDGAMRHWWTAQDSLRFQAMAEPLVQQFSGYRPLPDMAINGRLTASENIADLAGLAAAFDAHRRALGSRATDKAYVRQQDREFFLGFAQSWRSKLDETAMRRQLANDHAPDMYRVATVRNFDAWYDAFDVTPGQRLYLEPGARVRIW